jgi:hypothetical protein
MIWNTPDWDEQNMITAITSMLRHHHDHCMLQHLNIHSTGYSQEHHDDFIELMKVIRTKEIMKTSRTYIRSMSLGNISGGSTCDRTSSRNNKSRTVEYLIECLPQLTQLRTLSFIFDENDADTVKDKLILCL